MLTIHNIQKIKEVEWEYTIERAVEYKDSYRFVIRHQMGELHPIVLSRRMRIVDGRKCYKLSIGGRSMGYVTSDWIEDKDNLIAKFGSIIRLQS
jgi:histone deacetylase complex regulatory component SIN3